MIARRKPPRLQNPATSGVRNPQNLNSSVSISRSSGEAKFSVMTWVATIAAVVAALFAGLQAYVSRDEESTSERAYVDASNFQIVTYGGKDAAGNRKWQLATLITNTGNTSTRRMMVHGVTGVGGDPETSFDWAVSKDQFSPYVLLPKEEKAVGLLFLDAKNAQDAEHSISGAGIIRYEDIFGGIHLTEYCVRGQYDYIDWQNYPAGEPIRGRLYRCSTHNCEDDECGRDWRERAERLR
jgi:hypothetical protein